MKAKYLWLLLAAALMAGTPALAKEKKAKAKTEQKAKSKGKSLFGKKKKQAHYGGSWSARNGRFLHLGCLLGIWSAKNAQILHSGCPS